MNWSPYLTYVWTKKEINKWYDTYGVFAFYDGKAYILEAKKLPGSSRYSVKFVEHS